MMPTLNTSVNVDPMPMRVDFSTGIVSLGSCFANEIGQRLQESGFHTELNPFGTLYNPASMAEALERLMEEREITEDDLVEHEGLWHSWHHHGSFSRPTAAETLTACNSRLHEAHQALCEAKLLMLTFGTAWVFEHEDRVVANCHKLPNTMFKRRRMTIEEVVARWQPVLQRLYAFNPSLTVLFSVSPIRHLGDGAHSNQLSKSTLLLAIDQLVSIFNSQSSISYFPAYEIVLDELRDYRFYGPDMAHPSELAVEVVWEKFQCAAMVPAVREQGHYNFKENKRNHHIPLHP